MKHFIVTYQVIDDGMVDMVEVRCFARTAADAAIIGQRVMAARRADYAELYSVEDILQHV